MIFSRPDHKAKSSPPSDRARLLRLRLSHKRGKLANAASEP
jgi:hypothetical protein